MTKKILIADDHDLIRDGLTAILKGQDDLEIIGQTGSGEQAVEMAQTLTPDLLLLDLSLPDLDGMEVLRRLTAQKSTIKVLILTVHEDETLLREALRNGAAGYIIKRAAGTELVGAIQRVLAGELYIHPEMTRSVLLTRPESTQEEDQRLTDRETEVLVLIARGYTNREVSHLLTITIRTVEKHRANIKQKLGARSRTDLLEYAREQRLI